MTQSTFEKTPMRRNQFFRNKSYLKTTKQFPIDDLSSIDWHQGSFFSLPEVQDLLGFIEVAFGPYARLSMAPGEPNTVEYDVICDEHGNDLINTSGRSRHYYQGFDHGSALDELWLPLPNPSDDRTVTHSAEWLQGYLDGCQIALYDLGDQREQLPEYQCGIQSGINSLYTNCSGLMIPDTQIGGTLATQEVFNEKTTSFLYP